MRKNGKGLNFIIIAAVAAACMGAGVALVDSDPYLAIIINGAGISIIMGLSVNLISGLTGQLALGHAGFMAIGAYTSAVLVMQLGLPIPVGLLAGGLLSAVAGFIIGYPTLKLSGDYLAIATLGFGQIIQVVITNLKDLTGGAAGLYGVPYFVNDKNSRDIANFLWIFGVLILVVVMLQNLKRSSYGRALISVREDEIASKAMGVDAFFYKMFAFILSTFVAGVGGALYAHFYNYLNPAMFSFLKSIDFVIIVVFGGIGSFSGTIVAGFFIAFLTEGLRNLKNLLNWKEIDDFRLVIYALLLIVIMLFKPSGLLGKKEISATAIFRGAHAFLTDPGARADRMKRIRAASARGKRAREAAMAARRDASKEGRK